MAADLIQSTYDQLQSAAQQFLQERDRIGSVEQSMTQQVERLRGGGWLAEGAQEFYRQMETDVLPGVHRLVSALDTANRVTLQIVQLLQRAEEEAAAHLTGEGGTNGAGGIMAVALKSPSGPPTGPDSSGGFHVGPPTHPNIHHDNGFTEFCDANSGHADCSTNASAGDYFNRAKYEAMLRGAQALGHLDDGTEAYSHYLYGNGADWRFNYAEFVNEDPNGRTAYTNLLTEAQRNAEIIGQGRRSFSMTSDAFAVGSGDPRFPYPSTENWQKAIGAHQVWTSSDVSVTTNQLGQRVYTMETTFHGEDRYNFNPGAGDIATGALDRDNGRFEVLGWAHPFMSYGETTSTVTWTEGSIPGSQYSEPDPARADDRGEGSAGGDRRGEIGDR